MPNARRVFVIGGTGFIGTRVLRELCRDGHSITVLHRGKTSAELLPGVKYVRGDRGQLIELASGETDVVIHMICGNRRDARDLIAAFRGRAARAVVPSSGDVYRAYAVLHGTEPGRQRVPISEDDALRSGPCPAAAKLPQDHWATSDYDKIHVEEVVRAAPDLPATILRLPMVYGPGDHRFKPWLDKMFAPLPEIRLGELASRWQGCWGYVENVAHAIALAASDERAAGRTYNVADDNTPPLKGLLEELGRASGWAGQITVVPPDQLAPEERIPFDSEQHFTMDTTRIRADLGYRALVPLAEAVARTVEWERHFAA